ncbi:hypothetical protein [Maridesulfovibrio ferrireducens]|nr:hypothetical protein [Maridesulfovibrio ferrireducens]
MRRFLSVYEGNRRKLYVYLRTIISGQVFDEDDWDEEDDGW